MVCIVYGPAHPILILQPPPSGGRQVRTALPLAPCRPRLGNATPQWYHTWDSHTSAPFAVDLRPLRKCSVLYSSRPHLTSPHLTSPHLTSPHLTDQHRLSSSGELLWPLSGPWYLPKLTSCFCHDPVYTLVLAVFLKVWWERRELVLERE